jgi:hypothetical protein
MNNKHNAFVAGTVRGVSEVEVAACDEFFVTMRLMDGSQRSVSLSSIRINFDDGNRRLKLEFTPD